MSSKTKAGFEIPSRGIDAKLSKQIELLENKQTQPKHCILYMMDQVTLVFLVVGVFIVAPLFSKSLIF